MLRRRGGTAPVVTETPSRASAAWLPRARYAALFATLTVLAIVSTVVVVLVGVSALSGGHYDGNPARTQAALAGSARPSATSAGISVPEGFRSGSGDPFARTTNSPFTEVDTRSSTGTGGGASLPSLPDLPGAEFATVGPAPHQQASSADSARAASDLRALAPDVVELIDQCTRSGARTIDAFVGAYYELRDQAATAPGATGSGPNCPTARILLADLVNVARQYVAASGPDAIAQAVRDYTAQASPSLPAAGPLASAPVVGPVVSVTSGSPPQPSATDDAGSASVAPASGAAAAESVDPTSTSSTDTPADPGEDAPTGPVPSSGSPDDPAAAGDTGITLPDGVSPTWGDPGPGSAHQPNQLGTERGRAGKSVEADPTPTTTPDPVESLPGDESPMPAADGS